MDKSDKSDENGPQEYCTFYFTLQLQVTQRAHAKCIVGFELDTIRSILTIQTTSPVGVSKSPISEHLYPYSYL